MGWLIKRLLAWAVAGALVAAIGAAAWYSFRIISAGASLTSVPPLTLALEVMQLHVHAAEGAGAGLLLGLLARFWRRLRLRIASLFSKAPPPTDRADPDALIRSERSQVAERYLSTLEKRSLEHVVVSADDADGGPDVENIITARDGLFTYRVLAYRHLSHAERVQIVKNALDQDHIKEPEPGGTTTILTSVGKPPG